MRGNICTSEKFVRANYQNYKVRFISIYSDTNSDKDKETDIQFG